jgi:hypothetical protein
VILTQPAVCAGHFNLKCSGLNRTRCLSRISWSSTQDIACCCKRRNDHLSCLGYRLSMGRRVEGLRLVAEKAQCILCRFTATHHYEYARATYSSRPFAGGLGGLNSLIGFPILQSALDLRSGKRQANKGRRRCPNLARLGLGVFSDARWSSIWQRITRP